MKIKLFLERTFPTVLIKYRQWRDMRIFFNRKLRKTSFGFDFIGVNSMPESRELSGEIILLKKLLLKATIFIDIGANCGFYTLFACGSGKVVYSFEPNLENFILLNKNLQINKFSANTILTAVGDKTDYIYLYGGGEGASYNTPQISDQRVS